MNQEMELKAAKVSLKDKNNDPTIKNLSALFQQFSLHLSDLQGVQKDMDKVFQLHKTTWDLQNLQAKLSLIENHQSIFSEEIFNSIHPSDRTTAKDRNNNSTIVAGRTKTPGNEKILQVTNENVAPIACVNKEKRNDPSSSTLKRKRDTKSPSAKSVADSPSSDATSRKQGATTATILVSKTKTKTGLPLLLKKWTPSEVVKVFSYRMKHSNILKRAIPFWGWTKFFQERLLRLNRCTFSLIVTESF